MCRHNLMEPANENRIPSMSVGISYTYESNKRSKYLVDSADKNNKFREEKYKNKRKIIIPQTECTAPSLGMENGKIADSQITASSQVTPAFLARLNGRFAWCSGAPQNNSYIQVSSRLTSRSQHSWASRTRELGFQQSAGVWSFGRRHLQRNFLKWFPPSIFFFRYFLYVI